MTCSKLKLDFYKNKNEMDFLKCYPGLYSTIFSGHFHEIEE